MIEPLSSAAKLPASTGFATTIEIRTLAELDAVSKAWERLRQREIIFFPSVDDLRCELQSREGRFLVLASAEGDDISALCCLVVDKALKRYTIGERKLFSLPVREARLLGSRILGEPTACVVRRFVDAAYRQLQFDLLAVGEVPVDSPLHRGLQALGPRYVLSSPSRKDSLRWLIQLPSSFEEYLQSLGAKTRQMVRQSMRKIEKMPHSEFRIVCEPAQVGEFLRLGEAISRLTYQWNVGQRLINDDATLQAYLALAHKGRLRCHLLFLEGEPCAFSRGEILDNVYSYHTPGFDPRHAKLSPGIVTLMWTIKDLIEHTHCKVFDFGEGGDEVGYKSKFGNVSIPSRYLYVSNRLRPYSLALTALQGSITALKNLLSFVIGHGKLRQRLKKAFRKYGA